jgi:hypothetical protein
LVDEVKAGPQGVILGAFAVVQQPLPIQLAEIGRPEPIAALEAPGDLVGSAQIIHDLGYGDRPIPGAGACQALPKGGGMSILSVVFRPSLGI